MRTGEPVFFGESDDPQTEQVREWKMRVTAVCIVGGITLEHFGKRFFTGAGMPDWVRALWSEL